jgi:hypothetical protein
MTQRNGGGTRSFADALCANNIPVNLTAFVEKTVSNLSKKKVNVVVTGLKEARSEKKMLIFSFVCAMNFSIKSRAWLKLFDWVNLQKPPTLVYFSLHFVQSTT